MDKYKLNELKIEVTYECPLTCVHCSSDAHIMNKLIMDKKRCLRILEEAIRMGVSKIALSGGEPLTWEGLDDAIEYCNLYNVETTIYTSGNCKNIPQRFKTLSSIGLNKAVFSLYSNEEIEHVRITRKKDSYKLTLEAIDAANSNGIDTEIHFVAMKMNYKCLEKIAELGKTIGVKRISVLRFVPQGRGEFLGEKGLLNRNQCNELRQSIIELRKLGYDIRTGSPWNVLWLNENPRCMAAQDRMIVAPDFRIYPCDAFKQVEYEELSPQDEFSVIETKSLEECWEKSDYFNIIRKTQNSKPEKPCDKCEKYRDCGSGCLAQKFLINGDLNRNPDPICIRGVV